MLLAWAAAELRNLKAADDWKGVMLSFLMKSRFQIAWPLPACAEGFLRGSNALLIFDEGCTGQFAASLEMVAVRSTRALYAQCMQTCPKVVGQFVSLHFKHCSVSRLDA